jgi:hypothetical protein
VGEGKEGKKKGRKKRRKGERKRENVVWVDADLGGSNTVAYTGPLRVGLANWAALGLTGASGPSALPPAGAVTVTLATTPDGLAIVLESWWEPNNPAEYAAQMRLQQYDVTEMGSACEGRV